MRPITLGELLNLLDRYEQGSLEMLNSPLPLVTTVALLDATQEYARRHDPLSEAEHNAIREDRITRLIEFGRAADRDEFDEDEWGDYMAETEEFKRAYTASCAEFIYPLLLDLERYDGEKELTSVGQAHLALWCLEQLDFGADPAIDYLLVGLRDVANGKDWSAPVRVAYKLLLVSEEGAEEVVTENLNDVFDEQLRVIGDVNPSRIEYQLLIEDPQLKASSLSSPPETEAQEMARSAAQAAALIALGDEDITTGVEDVAQMTLWSLRLAGATATQERAFVLTLDRMVRQELGQAMPTLSPPGSFGLPAQDQKPSAGENLEL